MGDRALTIALMIETGSPGGAEHMLLHLASALRARGHEIVPVGPRDRSQWLAGQFTDRGFTPERYTISHALDMQCVRQLTSILRRRRVDVVHSHEFTMAVMGSLAALVTRRPHVITMHGGRYYASAWRRRAAMKFAVARSSALIGVSSATVADLKRTLHLREGSVTMVHNGISFTPGNGERIRQELGVGADELLIVCVGNLYPVKGHATLIRALAHLGDAIPAWRLAIAGTGGEEASLAELAAQLRVVDRVRLLGYRSDINDLLAAATIYAMPSLSEGLPLGLLEAMFARKAIVASRVGGIPEAATDGETAIFAEPGDVASVAAAMQRVMCDVALREALAARAEHAVRDRFSVERMAEAYERLYMDSLARQRAPRLRRYAEAMPGSA